jgi:plastocyanin
MKSILALSLLIVLTPASAVAGTIKGVVTSNKASVSELQKAAVVWVEGPPAGSSTSSVPVLSQSGVQFSPRVLSVVAGQTVSFPNEDDVAHNVFSMSAAKKFKLGIYPKGETREVTFEKPGVIDLFCSIHRHMHAVIVVTPNEYVAQAVIGEPFTIANVPAGEYTIKAWNAAHQVYEAKVTVPADGEVEVPIVLAE